MVAENLSVVRFTPYGEAPYNIPPVFQKLFRFFESRGVQACVYGSAVRDWLLQTPWRAGQDVDVSVCGQGWCAPPMGQDRKQFAMNLAHQRYVTQMMMQGEVPSHMMVRLLPGSPLAEEVGHTDQHPFEFSVAKEFQPANLKALDTDIGICAVAADSKGFYVAEAFKHGWQNQELRIVRCRDARDAKRTIVRLQKLQNLPFFQDWTVVWPDAFEAFRVEAQAELDEEAERLSA